MQSACSDRGRTSLLTLALALGSLLATPGPARAAHPHWLQGVFPIANFAGFTSHYGPRTLWGRSSMHHGLDIAAPLGSPVRSWWSGRVEDVFQDGSCGIGVLIRSGAYDHVYCHLQGTVSGGTYRHGGGHVRVGQRVPAGSIIGAVGMTGRTTGPHLHWGIRHRGAWLDPSRVLREMVRSRRLHGRAARVGMGSAGRLSNP